MKKMLVVILFFSCCRDGYSQKNFPRQWDSTLEADSEKWKLITRRKAPGNISKMEFGPYSLVSIEKLDSPVHKVKTKEGAEFGLDLGYDAKMETGHEANMDLTRKIITQKTTYYRMLVADSKDTTETLYSFLSITKDEKETVGGVALKTLFHGHYNSEDNPRTTIGSMTVINGVILSDSGAVIWNFSITSGDLDNNASSADKPYQSSRYISGYLKNSEDSIQLNLVRSVSTFRFLGKTDTLYFEEGFDLVNRKGEHLAAYQRIGKDKKSSYVWMRKDLDPFYTRAISAFLALTIGK